LQLQKEKKALKDSCVRFRISMTDPVFVRRLRQG